MTNRSVVTAAQPIASAASSSTRIEGRMGNFNPLTMPTTGQATLVEMAGAHSLELTGLDTQFDPALQVWLSELAAPAPSTDPAVITAGKHLVLGYLNVFSGSFRFALPAGANVDRYHSVILWCDEFKKFFATVPLE